jgi:3-oxoacyl-[acyl-carrier protein] reductase
MSEKKVIIVTGGSRGIGRAVCLALAGPDAILHFNYFNPADPEAEQAEAQITESGVTQKNGFAKSTSVNVSNSEAVSGFFKQVLDESGRIDILVNNAGITRDSLMVRMKDHDWDAVLDVNLKGAFYCARTAAKVMMKQRSGRIINIASIVGVIGNPGQVNYVASKAGLIGLTKTAAKELAPRGITVNAVAPGFIETDMTVGLPEKVKSALLSQIPMGRAGQPEDVARAVAFLASDDSAYITGQVLHVSGGMYI